MFHATQYVRSVRYRKHTTHGSIAQWGVHRDGSNTTHRSPSTSLHDPWFYHILCGNRLRPREFGVVSLIPTFTVVFSLCRQTYLAGCHHCAPILRNNETQKTLSLSYAVEWVSFSYIRWCVLLVVAGRDFECLVVGDTFRSSRMHSTQGVCSFRCGCSWRSRDVAWLCSFATSTCIIPPVVRLLMILCAVYCRKRHPICLRLTSISEKCISRPCVELGRSYIAWLIALYVP